MTWGHVELHDVSVTSSVDTFACWVFVVISGSHMCVSDARKWRFRLTINDKLMDCLRWAYCWRLGDKTSSAHHTTPRHAGYSSCTWHCMHCAQMSCRTRTRLELFSTLFTDSNPSLNTDKRMVWLNCTAIYRVINCSRHEVTPITHFVLDKTTWTTENASDWSEHAILWQKVQKNEKGNPQPQRNLCYFLGI